MAKRFFAIKNVDRNASIISMFERLAKAREEELAKLREEFNLVGFVFASNGRPDYFLKELGSEVDETKFKVGRINRAGNDLMTLEPISFEINDRLSMTFTHSLADLIGRRVPSFTRLTRLTDLKVEAKQDGGFVLVKIESGRDYFAPVGLVEITESQYTDPDVDKLKSII